MIRNVLTLFRHDLAVAFKNKTLFLVFSIPLFVYATLMLVDPTAPRDVCVNIAFLQTDSYAPVMLESIKRAPDQISLRWVSNEAEAMRLLKEQEIDGFLMHDGGDASHLVLTVVRQGSIETLNILQLLSALQYAVEDRGPGWIAAVRPLQTGSIKRQTLPIWIMMMVLLIGFIVLPAQVAEEKEKQLLLGWMQTPVRESEWLAAKLAYGIVLMLASVAALHVMAGEPVREQGVSYLALLCVGGFCFGALGICLGLLCRNQASARTLGVLFYIPLLVPVALSDMSRELRVVAPLILSYQFYEPMRAMLLDDHNVVAFTRASIALPAIGVLACLISIRLIKKRWLM